MLLYFLAVSGSLYVNFKRFTSLSQARPNLYAQEWSLVGCILTENATTTCSLFLFISILRERGGEQRAGGQKKVVKAKMREI